MTSIAGSWRLRMKTPIGTIEADYRFTETADGILGTATGAGEEVALENVAAVAAPDGERVTWTQRITKPLRLNLAYDVTVEGDVLSGSSQAGRLPRTAVTGRRSPEST